MTKVNNRFFERITEYEKGIKPEKNPIAEKIINSVSTYLQLILNTRQGSVLLDPNFGVTDFTNQASANGSADIYAIEDEIKCMIKNYEPRLSKPMVKLVQDQSDVLSIIFSLEGFININDSEAPFRILISIGSSGKISLQ